MATKWLQQDNGNKRTTTRQWQQKDYNKTIPTKGLQDTKPVKTSTKETVTHRLLDALYVWRVPEVQLDIKWQHCVFGGRCWAFNSSGRHCASLGLGRQHTTSVHFIVTFVKFLKHAMHIPAYIQATAKFTAFESIIQRALQESKHIQYMVHTHNHTHSS